MDFPVFFRKYFIYWYSSIVNPYQYMMILISFLPLIDGSCSATQATTCTGSTLKRELNG